MNTLTHGEGMNEEREAVKVLDEAEYIYMRGVGHGSTSYVDVNEEDSLINC